MQPKPPDLKSHRPLLDKLGVRQGSRIDLEGLDEPAFVEQLRERGADLGGPPPYDLVFVQVARPDDLEELSRLRNRIVSHGAIWVLRAKGNSRTVTDVEIIDAARRHGLVDNKIASFSETLAAMRLVIPVALRKTER